MRIDCYRTLPDEHNSQYKEALATYHFIGRYVQGKSVLDAGCSFGYGTSFISGHAHRVTGADFDPETVAWAKRHHQGDRIMYLVSDLTACGCKAGSFEVACLFEVLNIVKRHTLLLQEMYRVLKPGGTLLLSTRRTHTKGVPVNPKDAQRSFTPEELTQQLSCAGFSVLETFALHRPQQVYALETELSRMRKLDSFNFRKVLPRPIVSLAVYMLSKLRHIRPPQELRDEDFMITRDLAALSPGLLVVCERKN